MKKSQVTPIAYWVSDRVKEIFEKESIGKYAYIGKGLDTCNQELYERSWVEVEKNKISFESIKEKIEKNKWYPFSKGGGYRKWYGNFWDVVLWEEDGKEIRNYRTFDGKIKSRPQNIDKYFRNSITWSSISSSNFGARILKKSIFGNGSALFIENKKIDEKIYFYFMGLMNSKINKMFTQILSPTLSFNAGDLMKIPVDKKIFENEKIYSLVTDNIQISKQEWDSRETSWDFEKLGLIRGNNLKESYDNIVNIGKNSSLKCIAMKRN